MNNRRFHAGGFTLIELMMAVVILGIIAAVAYPNYLDSVRESRRTTAKVALEETAQELERCFTKYGGYDDSDCSVAGSFKTDGGFYKIEVTTGASTFSVSASPRKDQKNDGCGSFHLNQTGKRSIKGSDPNITHSDCW